MTLDAEIEHVTEETKAVAELADQTHVDATPRATSEEAEDAPHSTPKEDVATEREAVAPAPILDCHR